ncbi:hypothetical protein RclHR1_17590002 [Rhizophagus clarus]|uniref:Endonuclease/exonuclease/phosphatase domain-containing protein n=1 Tax=Rhizophagus clarus TaxID=94130 RepID=A0A2Z6QKA7_9GLOM|nr:hypothetical protein RclHR1_17590002 [Rhizophagus clarus]GES94144.1 hypothetical protein RCL_jg27593.t1 [Rhizophagus clarus]
MTTSGSKVITKVTQQAESAQVMIQQEEHVSAQLLTTKLKPRRITKNLKNRNVKTPHLRQEAKMKSVATGANIGELGRPNRLIKFGNSIRPMVSTHDMSDTNYLQGSSSTSSTHKDGIVEGLESLCYRTFSLTTSLFGKPELTDYELAAIGQTPPHMAHSNNRMTCANRTIDLDYDNRIDNSHINNNNNIIDSYIGDKEQMEQSDDSHNDNSHLIEIVNQGGKAVDTFLSRERLIFEAGHLYSKNDLPQQQMGNHQDVNLVDENSLYLELSIAVHNIRGMGSIVTAHKLDDLMTSMQNDNIDIVVITETNTDRKKSSFLNITRYNTRYKFYFCNKNTITNKSIGYGVAIAVKMKWAKHIISMDLTSPYMISLELLFKKREIYISAIYAAPENKQQIHKMMIDNTIK